MCLALNQIMATADELVTITIRRLTDTSKCPYPIPQRYFYLYSDETDDKIVPPNKTRKIRTGIEIIDVPLAYYIESITSDIDGGYVHRFNIVSNSSGQIILSIFNMSEYVDLIVPTGMPVVLMKVCRRSDDTANNNSVPFGIEFHVTQ